jgi:very-short-patch-repair endonuclease
MAPAERLLWQALRTRLAHLHVRRQHPLGPYVLDFYHALTRTAFEIDGDVHALPEQVEHDRLRGEWLAAQRVRVVRFTNEDVLKRLDSVLEAIRAACEEEPSPPTPLP